MYQNDSVISAFPQEESFPDLAPKTKFVFKKNKIYAKPNHNLKSKSDSLLVKDSLHRIDSLKKVNLSKTLVVKPVSGREGKSVPSFSGNENWAFIAIIFFLFLLLLSIQKSSGAFFGSIKTLFKRKESKMSRTASMVNLFEYKVYSTLFILGVISMFVQEYFFISSEGFRFITFLKILGVTTAFYAVKIILIEFIGNVFFNKRLINTFKESYFSLVCLSTCLLFPLLILRTYCECGWDIPYNYIALFLLLFFHILLFIKVFQIFFTKLLDTFYIFLYLCTLEILPLFILFRVYNLVI